MTHIWNHLDRQTYHLGGGHRWALICLWVRAKLNGWKRGGTPPPLRRFGGHRFAHWALPHLTDPDPGNFFFRTLHLVPSIIHVPNLSRESPPVRSYAPRAKVSENFQPVYNLFLAQKCCFWPFFGLQRFPEKWKPSVPQFFHVGNFMKNIFCVYFGWKLALL